MSSQNRNNCLLVLVILLISHAALTLHVSSHVAADQQSCEICTGYSNLEHAPAPSVAAYFPPAVYLPEIFTEVARFPAAESTLYRQRAPPHDA